MVRMHRTGLSRRGWLMLGVALLSACSSHRGAVRDPAVAPTAVRALFSVERDRVYTPFGWPEPLRADLYRPQLPTPQPAVLLIHGGGWEGPDRRAQMASIAERLAQRGYVVMNASYRFAPQYRYPAPVEDLGEALRWLRAEAPRLGARADRVAVFGYSAGGHLAALLGTHPASAVQAVVAGGAPTDLRKYRGGRLVPQFLGGTREQLPDRFAEASPLTRVKPGDPPVFLYHGGLDTLVPPDHAEDYERALRSAGVPVELFLLHGRGHITAFLTDGAAIEAAIDFLDRRLR